MQIKQARELIHKEFISDNGLDVLFRMSADVEAERIAKFIKALKCLEQHYQHKDVIEKELIYQLFSMHQTLQASMGHWKVSNPEGLNKRTCFQIFDSIKSIFTS
ncbi:hypothetical protein [Aquimarina aquimarini]|uniref:hypothetical protein n=1 Tax=Aquimarina aquimarini TaxID=1191734 RepID=UPI000D5549E8|nr:hypothetical protein [Aquimarina aquimarini]